MARIVRRFFGKKRGARNMRSDKLGGASLGLFFGLFFLGGIVALGPILNNVTIPDWRAKHKFLETEAEVLDKRTIESGSPSGAVYRPELKISYQVGGRSFQVWAYDIPAIPTNDRNHAEVILAEYEIGKKYPCYYDPLDPSQAVLVRGYSLFAWMILILPGSFIAIGGGGLIYTFLHWNKSIERRAALVRKAWSLDPFAEEDANRDKYPNVPGQFYLSNSPGTRLAFRLASAVPSWRLLGTASICLFWNAVVIIFAVVVSQSYAEGRPEWFLTIALVPCALIGIGLVVFLVRQLLTTTGIGPTIVEIDHHPLQPGGRYQVFVTQANRVALDSLSITLVCDEEAIFRQGTNLRTASQRVYSDEIFRGDRTNGAADKPLEALCQFEIPAGAMHSFTSEHNKVSWKLIVQGGAPRSRDFQRAYAVHVYPRPTEGELA